MARLFKKKINIGRLFRDTEGNVFNLVEAHSGFIWLRGRRGLKQIPRSELRYYREVRRKR